MLVSIYKYIGDCGNGLIFTIPGRVLNIPGIDLDEWYLMGEYGVEEHFLEECAEKMDDGVWGNYYINRFIE